MCRGGQYVLRHLRHQSRVRRGFVGTLYCKQGLGNSSPPTACLVLRIPFSYICLFYMVLHFGIRSRIYYIYLTNNCLSTLYVVSTSHNVVTNSHAHLYVSSDKRVFPLDVSVAEALIFLTFVISPKDCTTHSCLSANRLAFTSGDFIQSSCLPRRKTFASGNLGQRNFGGKSQESFLAARRRKRRLAWICVISPEDRQGFEEVQARLTACGKPRRGFPLAGDSTSKFHAGPRRGPTASGET